MGFWIKSAKPNFPLQRLKDINPPMPPYHTNYPHQLVCIKKSPFVLSNGDFLQLFLKHAWFKVNCIELVPENAFEPWQ
jgi:hypothetical protein